jgi:gluconate 2-dehydrogenase gamma chain
MSDESRIITRRELLKGIGAAGAAAAAAPATVLGNDAAHAGHGASASASAAAAAQAPQSAVRAREAFEHLTAAESDLLEAILDRLIPSDELGPGAREARAAHYIDRALGGALADQREAYRTGLAALDTYARSSRGKPFLELTATEQDSVLIDVEFGTATAGMGFAGSSAQFFNMVKGHTWHGMFGDPYYGGNANYAGWDLLRYPGVRTNVSAADQERLERNELPPLRRSAYDNDMFNKATVSADPLGHRGHGDSGHGD